MIMFKASVGDYSGVAKDYCEDVMITGKSKFVISHLSLHQRRQAWVNE